MKNMIAGEKGLATSSKASSLERDETKFEDGGAGYLFVVLDNNGWWIEMV